MILEIFFDYACPYCLRGHEYLVELIRGSQIEPVWCPCEAHPRPENYGPHSDLCIQGMFFALEQGADIWAYHEIMYRAALKDNIDIENIYALAACVEGLLDPDMFCTAISSGKYRKALVHANDYAYEKSGVWTVPAYRMNGRKLDSVEGVGVTKAQLLRFLKDHVEVDSI